MTAEVAIMNKTGVALASDSAVTVQVGGDSKVYPSAEKIFMLSKYHPVGVMIYNASSFMGIGWETIIKLFRNQIGDLCLKKLSDYASAFIDYLRRNEDLFPEQDRLAYVKSTILSYFRRIDDAFGQRLADIARKNEELTTDRVEETFTNLVAEHYSRLKQRPVMVIDDTKSLSESEIAGLIARHEDLIAEAKKAVFDQYPLKSAVSRKINQIGQMLLYKQVETDNHSGIVIAGYGDQDIFPSLEAFHIEGLFDNFLRYRRYSRAAISMTNNASISPFAQSEMMKTFIEGVDPSYEEYLEYHFYSSVKAYATEVLNDLKTKVGMEIADLERRFDKINVSVTKQMIESLTRKRQEDSISQVLNIVATLPKPELAAMAESLVNLTTLKKKASTKLETVGGPIDVALISRGDGFIWIKRKHYFDEAHNRHFLRNYYRRDPCHGQQDATRPTDLSDQPPESSEG